MKQLFLVACCVMVLVRLAHSQELTAAEALASREPQTPEQVYLDTANKIGNQAWFGFQTKLQQTIESYFYRTNLENRFMKYITSKSGACPNDSEITGLVYRLTRKINSLPNERSYYIEHKACGERRLTERIAVLGDGQYKLTALGAFTGLRDFYAPEGQDRLEYQVRNEFGETLFRIIEEHTPRGRQFLFYIDHEVFFRMKYNKFKNSILVNIQGAKADWRFGPTGRYKGINDSGRSGMLGYLNNLGGTSFRGANSGSDYSLNEFRGYLNVYALKPLGILVSGYLSMLSDSFFPKSSFSRAGTANDELLETLDRLIALIQAGDRQTAISELRKIRNQVEANSIRVVQ